MEGYSWANDVAEVFQTAIDGIAASVAGAWVIEVRADIARSRLAHLRQGSEPG